MEMAQHPLSVFPRHWPFAECIDELKSFIGKPSAVASWFRPEVLAKIMSRNTTSFSLACMGALRTMTTRVTCGAAGGRLRISPCRSGQAALRLFQLLSSDFAIVDRSKFGSLNVTAIEFPLSGFGQPVSRCTEQRHASRVQAIKPLPAWCMLSRT